MCVDVVIIWVVLVDVTPQVLEVLGEGGESSFQFDDRFFLHLVYSLSSCVCLFLSLSFFWRCRVELVGSGGGVVWVFNKHVGGNKMHSVF